MRKKAALALIVVVGMFDLVMPALLRVSGSEAATTRNGAPYYLALGDSLAAGHQPRHGLANEGYAHDIRKTFAERLGGLRLQDVACVGVTSRSLLTRQRSACRYSAGSQLGAPLRRVTSHLGKSALLTVD